EGGRKTHEFPVWRSPLPIPAADLRNLSADGWTIGECIDAWLERRPARGPALSREDAGRRPGPAEPRVVAVPLHEIGSAQAADRERLVALLPQCAVVADAELARIAALREQPELRAGVDEALRAISGRHRADWEALLEQARNEPRDASQHLQGLT